MRLEFKITYWPEKGRYRFYCKYELSPYLAE